MDVKLTPEIALEMCRFGIALPLLAERLLA